MTPASQSNVLMLSYPYAPLAFAGSFRSMRFAKYLPEYGWNPIIVTIRLADASSDLIDESLNECVRKDTRVYRTRLFRPLHSLLQTVKRLGEFSHPQAVPKTDMPGSPDLQAKGRSRRSPLVRAIRSAHDLFFATPDAAIAWVLPTLLAAWPLVRKYRPRVIYSTGPPHSSHLIAVFLKALTRLPIVLDLRDPWARTDWKTGSRGSLRQGLQTRLERLCVKRSDRVIVNTDTLRKDLLCTYPREPEEKFVVISNGYDADLSLRTQSDGDSGLRLSDNGVIKLCHPGTIYGQRDLRPVIAAIRQLREAGTSIELDQVGAVDNGPSLQAEIESLGLKDAVFLRGQLSYAETMRYMQAADIFLLPQPGTSLQIPGKIFEMLPFGKPVLALTDPDSATARIVAQYELVLSYRRRRPRTSPARLWHCLRLCRDKPVRQLTDGKGQCRNSTAAGSHASSPTC